MKLRWSNGHSNSYEFDARLENLADDIVQGLHNYWQTICPETVELHVLSGKYWLNPAVETDVDLTLLGGHGNFWELKRFVARHKSPAQSFADIYRLENSLRAGLTASEEYMPQFSRGLLKFEDILIHPEHHQTGGENDR